MARDPPTNSPPQKKRDLIKLINEGKPLSEEFRFLLFENKREVEPVWNGKVPMANGHEIDCRLSTLAALQEKPNPPGATMPTDPPGITRLANGIIAWKVGGAAFDYFFRPIKPQTDQGGEMIYWERPDGGRVFNAGSIGAGWALMVDEKFQRLMRNVLAHFGVKRSAGFRFGGTSRGPRR